MGRRKHGEGTLFKRADGRWQASFVASDGKRKYFYGEKSSEALEKMRKAMQEDQKGLLASGKRVLLKDYLPQWLELVAKPQVFQGTYVQYEATVKKHLLPAFGHIMVHKLTVQQVQSFYAKKLEEGLAPGTVIYIHSILHMALDNAVSWGLISHNVTDKAKLPKRKRPDHRVLSLEEAKTLVKFARASRLETLLIMALTTAMRRGELLALQWSDIDFEKKTLQLRRSFRRVGNVGNIVKEPKTKAGQRRIMLTDFAIEALKRHKQLQEEQRERSTNWRDLDLVFPNTLGGYWSPDYMVLVFKKMLTQAQLPQIRFHDLRHSAATLLLAMGVHPKLVQDLLGHSKIATTMDTYSHVLPSMQKEVADKMGLAFTFEEDQEDEKDQKEEDQGDEKDQKEEN
ncbi:tyrosine-type recombinase/integrase [Ktedonobacter robiniae]|uniref:Site-specific integrase n=1 Tax=Ktedonobacter robiniae TaxID=2778365 RepID=A0ABQ3UQS5_9CHLR|nr:site-specific integrase [Ktedonobacter robiniae]GHO54800.1 site-specific integrase [Ktedonobacter robiniae]